jgi:hypothetical protein
LRGLLTLDVGGETMYREQLDPESPDDAEWLGAAGSGSILVIGGDNLVISESSLDIAAAAGLGTLVIGTVTVRCRLSTCIFRQLAGDSHHMSYAPHLCR